MRCSFCGENIGMGLERCPSCGEFLRLEDDNIYISQSNTDHNLEETKILWVLNGHFKKAIFNRIPCNIIFFEGGVILACLTKELQKTESAKIKEENKEKGYGFIRHGLTMMQYWMSYSNKYYTMDIREILKESSLNKLLKNSDIEKVLFTCLRESFANDDGSNTKNGRLTITTQKGEKYKFTHSTKHNSDIKVLLSKIFDRKLKYKS